jgi:hypothetical protein
MSSTYGTAIQVYWEGGHVVITPQDEGRFVRESQWAASVCQSAPAAEPFVERFKTEFLPPLREWCQAHHERIRACYVPFASPHLTVFVITRAGRYDFALSDALSDLGFELFQKNWPAEVLQVPSGSMEDFQSFFDPSSSIQVYGDPL